MNFFDILAKILIKLISVIENKSNFFITFNMRPKYANKYPVFNDIYKNNFSVGIVITGLIEEKNDFLINSILIYKKIFKNPCIIVSTWEIKNKKTKLRLEEEKVIIIENEKPKLEGILRINYQTTHASIGLKKLKEFDIQYAIKIRGDQRINSTNALDYLFFIYKKYNHQNEKFSSIVTISLDTFLFRPYSLCDMFHFGKVDDLIKYWDIQDDRKNILSMEITKSIRKFSEEEICEVFLCRNYLKKVGFAPDISISTYLEAIKKYFIIIDSESLDYFWMKYQRKEYFYRNYFAPNSKQINFSDWLSIREGILNIDEKIMEQEFNS